MHYRMRSIWYRHVVCGESPLERSSGEVLCVGTGKMLLEQMIHFDSLEQETNDFFCPCVLLVYTNGKEITDAVGTDDSFDSLEQETND